MRSIKKILVAICVCMAVLLVAPSTVPYSFGSVTAEAATVKLNKKKATLYVGDTLKLKVKGTKKKVKWSSSKKSVAKVSSKGKVTAKKAGKATITAKVGKKKYKCKITVKSNSNSEISIRGGNILNLNLGEVKQIEIVTDNGCELEYSIDSSFADVSWGNWNGNIITLNIKGKKTGTSIMKIYDANDSDIYQNITVNITETYTKEEELAAIWLHFLKSHLRNPDSLNVSSIHTFTQGTNHTSMLEINYSAQNAYGGTNYKTILGYLNPSSTNEDGSTPYIILPSGEYSFPCRRNQNPANMRAEVSNVKSLNIEKVERYLSTQNVQYKYNANFRTFSADSAGWFEKNALYNEVRQEP